MTLTNLILKDVKYKDKDGNVFNKTWFATFTKYPKCMICKEKTKQLKFGYLLIKKYESSLFFCEIHKIQMFETSRSGDKIYPITIEVKPKR